MKKFGYTSADESEINRITDPISSNNSKISTMKINKSIPKTLDSINIIPYIGSLIISCFALILKIRIK